MEAQTITKSGKYGMKFIADGKCCKDTWSCSHNSLNQGLLGLRVVKRGKRKKSYYIKSVEPDSALRTWVEFLNNGPQIFQVSCTYTDGQVPRTVYDTVQKQTWKSTEQNECLRVGGKMAITALQVKTKQGLGLRV